MRVTLGEYDIGWHEPALSLERAAALIAAAKSAGTELVALPEMCITGFTMDAARYSEELDGPSVQQLTHLARQHSIHIIAGMATRSRSDTGERFYNSALLINADGALVAEYRKQRLFAYAMEEQTYTAGDGPVIVDVNGVQLGLFICFDLRFPELFREVASEVDALVVIASWPGARQEHWDTLLRARAIENQAYVIGVNRVGRGGELEYKGGSAVYGPWGELLGTGSSSPVNIDRDVVTSARTKFPLIEDRRRF
jgi:predicted amidohydrolase